MGNVGAKLHVRITSDGPVYAGSVVYGVIYLGVESTSISCSQLLISLTGRETSTVTYNETEHYTDSNGKSQTRTVRRTANDNNKFYAVDGSIFNYNGALDRGRYEYPFSIHLPEHLPSSFAAASYSVLYTLEAKLERPGWADWNVSHKIYIPIIQTSPLPLIAPLRIGPVQSTIRRCCVSTGDMLLVAHSAQDHVAAGDCMLVNYLLKNCSSTKVDRVTICLRQQVLLKAHDHRDFVSKELCTVQILGEHIPDAAPDTVPLAQYMRGLNIDETLERSDLLVRMEVPQNAPPDYSGRLIQVSHHIMVQVFTEVCASNVEVSVPFRLSSCFRAPVVVPLMQEMQQQGEFEQPSAPSLFTAVALGEEALPIDWEHTAVRATPVYI